MINYKNIIPSKNINIQRFFLGLVLIFSPFVMFPVHLPMIGSSIDHLFLLLGYALFAYEIFIQKKSFNRIEKCSFIFLVVSTVWMAITNITGVWNYPYYGQIDLMQMENFKNFFDNASTFIPLDDLLCIKSWLSYKAVRSSLFEIFYAYFISLWVYHIYKNNWKLVFRDLRQTLLVLCGVLICYSFFETDYLTGGTVGKTVLEKINPLYMDIANSHGWWPPLFWNGQLRSMFCEPSFYGIFAAMALPIFFSFYYDEKVQASSVLGRIMYPFLVIMLVLSKSRTGNILFIGELFLLAFWEIVFYRKQWKRFLSIGLVTCLAFFAGLGISTQFQSFQSFDNKTVSVENYLEQNVTSVTGDQRSNSARRANTRATMRTALQHPLFGVGHGMKDMYLLHNLTSDELEVPEVKNKWTKYMYEKGPLKSAYPVLNRLAGVFVEEGGIGLLLYIFPIVFLFWQLLKHKWLLNDTSIACTTIALCGLCVSFLSNDATIYYYLVVGYMLIAIDSGKGDRGEKDE